MVKVAKLNGSNSLIKNLILLAFLNLFINRETCRTLLIYKIFNLMYSSFSVLYEAAHHHHLWIASIFYSDQASEDRVEVSDSILYAFYLLQ
jgi:hypothetical protein